MTDRSFELTRRKALAGLATVGAAGAGAGLGTSALFNDTESFLNNSIQAGTLNLQVNGQLIASNYADAPGPTVTKDGDTPKAVIELSDVKPGDYYVYCFEMIVQGNPGYVQVFSGGLDSNEGTGPNANPEPETNTDPSDGGELDDLLLTTLWQSFDGPTDGTGTREDLANLLPETNDDSDSVETVSYQMPAAIPGPEYGAVSGTVDYTTFSQVYERFDGGVTIVDGSGMPLAIGSGDPSSSGDEPDRLFMYLLLELPAEVGNEVQGDELSFDLEFVAEQTRNNDVPFNDLQGLIDETPSGGTLSLPPGDYRGGVTIDKPITIKGPTAGTSGKTANNAGSPSATIYPITDDSAGIVLDVQSDGVVIDGVVVDGDSPELTGGTSLNGAEVNAGYGVLNTGPGRNGDMTVRNTIFRNLPFGLYFWGPNSGATGGVAKGCLFQNTDRGIIPIFNSYPEIAGNCMRDVRIGIQTNTYYNANSGGAALIEDNDIESSRLGIWHNLHFSNASPFTIQDNLLSSTTGSSENWGLFLSSIQSGVDADVLDNEVKDSEYGVAAWNLPTSATVSVEGGTLTNNKVGAVAFEDYVDYNGDGNADGAPFSVTFDGISISGSSDVDVLATEDSGYETFSEDDDAGSSGVQDSGEPEVQVTLQNMGGVSTREEGGAEIN
ncbi:SipW-dependent-type signal peptide-containing protein [Haloglomus litoreum]|uniref:SipW-dependent-type signal peptide-containing protein n=1 Tax=Haloglomus litoreum TaxID=3034026 RepID=UPI0023E893F2|nr:SipW-dependent-type signal peptide-containing protein [Haloglomus sp. DT116]